MLTVVAQMTEHSALRIRSILVSLMYGVLKKRAAAQPKNSR